MLCLISAYSATPLSLFNNKNEEFNGVRTRKAGLQIRVHTGKLFFLFLNQNLCCGYSKEPSQWDGSFEQPKHMFKLMGKEINTILGAQTILIWTNGKGNRSWKVCDLVERQVTPCFWFGLFWCFSSQSTAMVILGQSVHLTTLFPGQAWTSS